MMEMNYMNRSSTRGIFLSVVLLFSVVLIIFPSNVYGEGISVTGIALEETTVLELTNDSAEEVNTLRIWLGSDFNFKSFKTEKGWVGEKNAQGVIIFTSSQAIKPGESVKFGVKTDKPNPGINWKALDKKDTQISTGTSIAKDLPGVKNLDPIQSSENTGESIFTESIFRIVPEKPNSGSTIRVTGEKFGVSQEFDFYIDTEKVGSFETDSNGHFITTMKIPENQNADRVDFKVINKNGEEKKISLRIGENENRIPSSLIIPLTVKGIGDIIHRGDFLEILGTGTSSSGVTIEIHGPDDKIFRTITTETNSKGDWKLEPLLVPLDRPFGKYIGIISDGREEVMLHWTVESDKKIIIIPTSLKFDQGETMQFNGTALPNISIELVLKDPLGKEIASDILQVDGSGNVKYEHPTTQNTIKGTYTLIATQEKHKEFIYAGIGQLPTIPVNLEFDKMNYKTGDNAVITLSGKASEIISLLIIDPSDKPKGDTVSITLQPDGRGTHTLNLEEYASGVYTAVISKGNDKSTEIFTVGLQTGSGEIEINTTKIGYQPGDPILILGDTGPNVLLTLTLLDPDGNKIKVKEAFSNKNGKISESGFRVPSDANAGVWILNAKSGSNFDNVEIQIMTSVIEGMTVSVEQGENIPGVGDTIVIKVFGAEQNVAIEIVSESGEVIGELEGVITSAGIINQLWPIPKETEPGTYTIKVENPSDSAEATYELE
jgi:hypothetical protein